jgi:oligogalacturonide lyase
VSNGITRRAMLAALPGCLFADTVAKKAKSLPHTSEFFRFLDPITETPVVRLTNIRTNSFLPAPTNRFVSVKDRFLIFSSDRRGSLAPFQLDLHTGLVSQLAKPQKLQPESLCLNGKRNALYFLDGDALQEVMLANRRSRVLAENVSSFCEMGSGADANPNFAIVRQGRLETLNSGSNVLAQDVENFCLTRPGGAGCAFQKLTNSTQRELWYAPFSAPGNPVLLARGKMANPVWAPDGKALLFLREVARQSSVASEIHSVSPEAPTERRVAATSQFAAFSPNADASVFVGASRSKAQPTVLLLVASVQREFTLCEHRASHPAAVSPVFSPDSKRVYFQSDHEGKSALYSVNVESLVESTSGNDS